MGRAEQSYPQTIADQIYALKIEYARRGQEIPNCNDQAGIKRLASELRSMQDQIDAFSQQLNRIDVIRP